VDIQQKTIREQFLENKIQNEPTHLSPGDEISLSKI